MSEDWISFLTLTCLFYHSINFPVVTETVFFTIADTDSTFVKWGLIVSPPPHCPLALWRALAGVWNNKRMECGVHENWSEFKSRFVSYCLAQCPERGCLLFCVETASVVRLNSHKAWGLGVTPWKCGQAFSALSPSHSFQHLKGLEECFLS